MDKEQTVNFNKEAFYLGRNLYAPAPISANIYAHNGCVQQQSHAYANTDLLCDLKAGKVKSRLLMGAALSDLSVVSASLTSPYAAQELSYLDEAFLLSVTLGHVECARTLLAHGADVSFRRQGSLPALSLAVLHRQYRLINLLQSHPLLDVNIADLETGNTALHVASHCDDVYAASVLLRRGSNPDIFNAQSETALCIAAKMGSCKMLEVLLVGGADPYLSKFNNHTVFHTVVENGLLHCVQIFIACGVDTNHTDVNGRSVLHMAAHKGHIGILNLLLQSGANPNQQDRDLHTPLFTAISSRRLDCVASLIEARADINVQNKLGNTPALSAVMLKQDDILKLLLKYNCDINTPGFRQMTPLHVAAYYGRLECTRLLLEAGAKPCAQTYAGYTPVHYAVRSQVEPSLAIDTLRFLLFVNVDFETTCSVKDGDSVHFKTPFQLAMSLGAVDIACWLALAGVKLRFEPCMCSAEDGCMISTCNKSCPEDIKACVPQQAKSTEALKYNKISDDELFQKLLSLSAKPRSLLQQSRSVIRKSLGKHIHQTVHQTGLPTSLQEYVTFKALCANVSMWSHERQQIISTQ